jgi:hypothetical protein
LNALADADALGLKLIIAPVIPTSLCEYSLNQPVRPAGTNVSKRGVVRGKLLLMLLRNWQLPDMEKLSPISASS